LDHQNNFVKTLKIISNDAKNFNILATSLSVLHNYLEFNKITFLIYIQLNFQQNRSFRARIVYWSRRQFILHFRLQFCDRDNTRKIIFLAKLFMAI